MTHVFVHTSKIPAERARLATNSCTTGGLTPGRNSRRQRHLPALDDEELFVVEGFPLAECAHSCTSAKTNYSVLSCGISTVSALSGPNRAPVVAQRRARQPPQTANSAVFCTVWIVHLSSTTTGMSTTPKNCTRRI